MPGANRYREEDLEKLRALRPIDDDFMRCIFRNNKPLAQLVLRIITEKPDLIVQELETQADLKRLGGGRSVSLDALATDSENRKYDIEIQRQDRGAEKHRARFHSAAMDVDNLEANHNFDELPDTFTIFITENDIFGDGKPFHRIERVDLDDGNRLFNDGEHILYVSAAYRGDSEIGRLMHDFCCADPNDMNYDLMREAAKFYKENPEGVEIMCMAFEETRNKAVYRNSIEIALKMINRGKDSPEEIAFITGLPLETVRELAGQKTA